MAGPESMRDLEALAARAARGEPGAEAALDTHLRPCLVRYCRARLAAGTAGHGAADGIAERAWLAVRAGLRDRGDGPFLRFAYATAAAAVAGAAAATAVADAVAGGGAAAPGAGSPAGPGPGIAAQLARLPAVQREVLVLRLAVGLSAEQVGVALGMRPGAVRVTQHRALTRLRETNRSGPAPPHLVRFAPSARRGPAG